MKFQYVFDTAALGFNPIQYGGGGGGALWPPIGFSYAASKRFAVGR